MKRIITMVIGLLVFNILFAAPMIKGPFIILSTAYYEDGSVDYNCLIKEARFVSKWGTSGVIWPQSNDAIDLLTKEERFLGMEALIKEWKENPVKTTLAIGVSGDDTQEMLEYAKEAERLANEYDVDIALCARPPYYGTSTAEQKEYFEALATVATHPVIIQTYTNNNVPTMPVSFLIELAQKYPDIYGWIKEESDGLKANSRQEQELQSPYIKTVFSAWGGWQWLYQQRQIGTCGMISERSAYAPIVNCVWSIMESGDKKGHLTEAYAMYRLVIDQRFLEHDGLRGYQLHYLVREGIFQNMISRTYIGLPDAPNQTYSRGAKSRWILKNEKFNPSMIAELDKCYDDMIKFVKKHKKHNK